MKCAVRCFEADVALPVVKAFIDRVRERAVGQEVSKSLSPGQQFVKIVQQELEAIMGEANEGLVLKGSPAVILMAGLQGAGKTTTVAKLARYLREREKKKVLVVSADVYRPAAIDQLETLAREVEVDFFPSDSSQQPVAIAEAAMKHARIQFHDVVLVDTAGRLHVDADMMDEIAALHRSVNPDETLFVVDAMTGQDAANTAKAFHEALPLTGVVLTKADGDARGGAALSVRHITGKPIKFMGMGEKVDALEPSHPDRIASRILGMGDMLSLIEEAERSVDKTKAEQLAKKVQKGSGFDLEDFRDQLQQLKNMGGMGSLMSKLPGMGQLAEVAQSQASEKELGKLEAMINSMTPEAASQPGSHQWLAQASHLHGLRYPGAGPQSSAQAAQADGQDDEEGRQERWHAEDDAWHVRHDGRRRSRWHGWPRRHGRSRRDGRHGWPGGGRFPRR